MIHWPNTPEDAARAAIQHLDRIAGSGSPCFSAPVMIPARLMADLSTGWGEMPSGRTVTVTVRYRRFVGRHGAIDVIDRQAVEFELAQMIAAERHRIAADWNRSAVSLQYGDMADE